ncbi:MAG: galactosyltransferase-related protein, partial [bacterium]|nr:galactosyltransferase-related protein [bacterium]
KNIFQEINGFDENFFMYFEDVDLCKRVREKGYKIIYLPEFIVKHLSGKSLKNKREQKRYFYSSQDYYFEKHFGKMTSNLVKLLRRLTLTRK